MHGYEALKEIEQCIQRSDRDGLARACSLFYTRIPHYFGMQRPPLITTLGEIKEKIQLLEVPCARAARRVADAAVDALGRPLATSKLPWRYWIAATLRRKTQVRGGAWLLSVIRAAPCSPSRRLCSHRTLSQFELRDCAGGPGRRGVSADPGVHCEHARADA